MDPITIVGLLIALGTTFAAMTMGGIDPMSIFLADIGSIILVFGGAVGATLASNTMEDATNAGKVAAKGIMAPKPPDKQATIEQLLGFAETARKEGLLALESAAKSIEDPFLKKGIEMSVDGTDPEGDRGSARRRRRVLHHRRRLLAGVRRGRHGDRPHRHVEQPE